MRSPPRAGGADRRGPARTAAHGTGRRRVAAAGTRHLSCPPRLGFRIHGAVDILAPRGTPVLSADAGRVIRLHHNRNGGLTIYASDESERFVYYYAHLSAYRHGIIKGTRLARGQVIGFVGTTGNADRRAPHLHFQVMARRRGGRWWKGEPIDPRPFFASTGRAR